MESLWQVREDFTPFREATSVLENELSEGKLKDQLETYDEYQNTVNALIEKIKKPKPRLLQAVWNIVKEASLLKISTRTMDELLKHDIENQRLSRVEGFYDIWSSSIRVRDYSSLISKVFGDINEGKDKYLIKSLDWYENIVKPIRKELPEN